MGVQLRLATLHNLGNYYHMRAKVAVPIDQKIGEPIPEYKGSNPSPALEMCIGLGSQSPQKRVGANPATLWEPIPHFRRCFFRQGAFCGSVGHSLPQ